MDSCSGVVDGGMCVRFDSIEIVGTNLVAVQAFRVSLCVCVCDSTTAERVSLCVCV